MKFSTQEEYGIRCILAVATSKNGSLTIPELSNLEGLSQPHVAKLMSILRNGGFVKSNRGQTGGYSLSRSPEHINVGQVLAALGGRLVEEGFCDRHSGNLEECVHAGENCKISCLWSSIQKAVDAVLDALSLQDILDGNLPASDTLLRLEARA